MPVVSELNDFKKTAALANTISTRMTAWIETMERLMSAPDTKENQLLRADVRTALIDYDELLMETTKLPNEAHVQRALKVVN